VIFVAKDKYKKFSRQFLKMEFKKSWWSVIIFTLLYISVYSIYYISIKNFEFLWYIFVLLFFFGLIFFTIKKTKFDTVILWGLSIWGLLHMSGGGLIINGDVLYNLEIIKLFDVGDTFVLKFDQFVHAFGFGVTTLVAYHVLKPYLNKKTNWKVVYPLLVLISMGLGALNEIVEFLALVSFSAVNVGGYYNTILDIIFNTIGAIIAVVYIHIYRR